MASIRSTKFDLTEKERLLAAPPLGPAEFKEALIHTRPSLLGYVVRAYVRDRVPAAFLTKPMLWESVRHWLAKRVSSLSGTSVIPLEIGVSGSGNLGFSPVREKYGRPFGTGSDLDLFIINAALFDKVRRDTTRFLAENAPRYVDQRATLARQLSRGLIDTHHLPAIHEIYPMTAMLLDEASIVIQKLTVEGIPLKRSHVRVYESWPALANQLDKNYGQLRTELQS